MGEGLELVSSGGLGVVELEDGDVGDLAAEVDVAGKGTVLNGKALETQDLAGLAKLLDDGKRRKEEVDGR